MIKAKQAQKSSNTKALEKIEIAIVHAIEDGKFEIKLDERISSEVFNALENSGYEVSNYLPITISWR